MACALKKPDAMSWWYDCKISSREGLSPAEDGKGGAAPIVVAAAMLAKLGWWCNGASRVAPLGWWLRWCMSGTLVCDCDRGPAR